MKTSLDGFIGPSLQRSAPRNPLPCRFRNSRGVRRRLVAPSRSPAPAVPCAAAWPDGLVWETVRHDRALAREILPSRGWVGQRVMEGVHAPSAARTSSTFPISDGVRASLRCTKRVDSASCAIVTEPREVKHGYRAGDSTEKGSLSAIPVSALPSILFAFDLSQLRLLSGGPGGTRL
jgi:hypothetical protein